jgi:hypothetical protein
MNGNEKTGNNLIQVAASIDKALCKMTITTLFTIYYVENKNDIHSTLDFDLPNYET